MSETESVKDNKRGGEPEKWGDNIYSISHIYSLIYGHSLKCYTDLPTVSLLHPNSLYLFMW